MSSGRQHDGATAPLGPQDRQRYRRLRRRTFILTWLTYASYYLCRKNISIAKLELKSVARGVGDVELGNIDTAYSTAYAMGQFPNGLLGDRIGGKWLVVLGMAATAGINLGMSMWPTYGALLVLAALNGGAQSTGWPGCGKIFSRWFAVSERGTAMGIWCTCYTVGGIAANMLATFVNEAIGWRAIFWVPALVVLALAAILVFKLRSAPKRVGLPDVEEYYAEVTRDDAGAAAPAAKADGDRSRRSRDDLRLVLSSRPIWTLGLSYMTLKFFRYALLFWAPLYMREQLGYSKQEAGYTSVAFEVLGFFGPIAAGLVSDRLFSARRPPVVVLFMVVLTIVAFGFFSLSNSGRVANIVALGLVGFFLYGPDSMVSGVAAVDYGGPAAGSAAGFVNALGSVGQVLQGLVVGRVKTAYGWSGVFRLFGPVCLLGTLLMMSLLRRRKEEPGSSRGGDG